MGITAENVARKHSISREAQDALAIESHKRAARAQAEGRFTSQILPIEVKTRKGTTVFDTDEHVRADASLDDMTKLSPAFDTEGSVTAGNASGITDGAAAVVIASQKDVDEKRCKPMGRITGWGHAGAEQIIRGVGTGKAVPVATKRGGI